MKYVKQFLIILSVTFAGEILEHLLPLPVPAGIYGIVLMLFLLLSGILQLSAVKETAHFLVNIMLPMFIPAVTGIVDCFPLIRDSWYLYLLIVVLSTAGVMAVSGLVTQAVIRKEENAHE